MSCRTLTQRTEREYKHTRTFTITLWVCLDEAVRIINPSLLIDLFEGRTVTGNSSYVMWKEKEVSGYETRSM